MPLLFAFILLFLKWNLVVGGLMAVLGEDDQPPALLSDAQAGSLIGAARATLMGEVAPPAPLPLDIVGAAVTVYGANGPRYGAGCFGADAQAAIVCAAREARAEAPDFGDAPEDLVAIHLLYNGRVPGWWWRLSDKTLGHERGLYAVLHVGSRRASVIPDTQMHVLGLTFEKAVSLLDKNRMGFPMAGETTGKGAFVVSTESFTEYRGRPVRLYRASTLLPAVDSSQIRANCGLGGDYLVNILRGNRQWWYEGNLGFDRYNNNYNLLRHAGTIYSLYQLHLATGTNRYRDAADSGWIWLTQQLGREKDDAGNWCAFPVEKKSKKTSSGKKKTTYTVKLGGTGLALIALSERLKVEPSKRDLQLGREMANHILRSQRPDGSFFSYWPYRGSKGKMRRSIYYPGEAMLGLIRFYQHDANPAYLEAVRRSAQYFIHERWNVLGMRFNVPPDAWLMLALNDLHKQAPQEDYVDHCETLVDSMANDQFDRAWEITYPDYAGGYFPYPPQVTPAGSRLEGITACYQAIGRAGRDTTWVRDVIAHAVRFQIERMIRPEFAHLYPNPQRALGAFRHSPVANAIRIDYNQHNISGLLIAADILAD